MSALVSQLLRRARGADERAKELKHQAGEYVALARDAGATWADVGAAFGITRQSAYQRFAAVARGRSTRSVTARGR